jgi:hypothetical protein
MIFPDRVTKKNESKRHLLIEKQEFLLRQRHPVSKNTAG